MPTALLTFDDVHVSFPGVEVLKGLSLELMPGEHTLIFGPSGAGKTTLLNLASGLIQPSSGAVRYRGESLVTMRDLARYRRQSIGQVFQDLHLIETLSAYDNIALVQAAIGAGPDAPDPEALLSPLGLSDKLKTRVSRLSRGERQRVALARAFANNPALILADEPTSSLDPGRRAETLTYLWTLCAQTGATALIVSHDAALRQGPSFQHELDLSAA